jgi:hypothetical protein
LAEAITQCQHSLDHVYEKLQPSESARSKGQDILQSIRQLLDDQIVRFDIWKSEANVDPGTFVASDGKVDDDNTKIGHNCGVLELTKTILHDTNQHCYSVLDHVAALHGKNVLM